MSQENNFIPEQEPYKKITPFRLFVKSNFPFIEATYEALDNYGLYCKIVEYLNDVISNENIVESNVQELYNAFISLNDYVSDYFENLDVNTEINNKLDEMAENGQLQTLVSNIFIDLQEQINSISSGSPSGVYDTLQDLQNDNPNHDKIYVVNSDGKWYYWSTSQNNWLAGGIYQASLPTEDVSELKYKMNLITQPISASFDSSDLTKIEGGYIGLETIDSGNTYSCYMRCMPEQNYQISKISSNRFTVACTENTPDIGIPVSNRIEYGSNTSITYHTSANAKYIVIYYWINSDTLSESDIFNSFSINGYLPTAKDEIAENDIESIETNLVTLNNHDEIIFPKNYKNYVTVPENYTQSDRVNILINTETVGKGFIKTISIFLGEIGDSKILIYEKDSTNYILKDVFTFNATNGENIIDINKYYDNDVYIGLYGKVRYSGDINKHIDVFAFSENDLPLSSKLATVNSYFFLTVEKESNFDIIENDLSILNEHDEFLFPVDVKTYSTLSANPLQTNRANILIDTDTIGKGFIKTISVYLGEESGSKILIYEKDSTTYILKDVFTFNATNGNNIIDIYRYYDNDVYIGVYGKIKYDWNNNKSVDLFAFTESDLPISTKLNTLGANFFAEIFKGSELDYFHSVLPDTITVSPNGFYKTIQDGINAVSDGGTVYVDEGTYNESIDVRNKTINIIGKNKYTCILKDDSGNYDTPPLEMSSGSVQNMTIIETSANATPTTTGITSPTLAYCIHADFDQMTNKTLYISNCILICNKRACIGIGVRNGFKFIMENCTLNSGIQQDTNHPPRGALYIHTQNGTETTRASVLLKDNYIKCNDRLAMSLEDYGGIGFNLESIENTLVANTDDISDDIIEGTNEIPLTFTNNVTSNGGITRFCTSHGNNINLLNYNI